MSCQEEICTVLSRFLQGVDEQDGALVRSTLAQDAETIMELEGEIIGHSQGRGEIVDFLEEFWKTQTDQRRHVFSNAFVEREDERSATLVSYMTLHSTQNRVLRPVATGRYRDEFVKQAEGWKIRKRHLSLDGPFD